MVNKSGGKVRLTFKFEADQIWIGSKELTNKIQMNSIRSVISEPIQGREEYHIVVSYDPFQFLLVEKTNLEKFRSEFFRPVKVSLKNYELSCEITLKIWVCYSMASVNISINRTDSINSGRTPLFWVKPCYESQRNCKRSVEDLLFISTGSPVRANGSVEILALLGSGAICGCHERCYSREMAKFLVLLRLVEKLTVKLEPF